MGRVLEITLLAAGLLGHGCAGDGGPATGPLRGGERTVRSVDVPGLRVVDGGRGAWIDHDLAPSAWRPDGRPGTWVAHRPDGLGFLKSGESLTLGDGARQYANQLRVADGTKLDLLGVDEFAALGDRLHLRLPEGEEPGALRFSVERRRDLDGRPVLGAWTGEGFSLWPGETMGFDLPGGDGRALSFHWAWEPLGEGAPRLDVLLAGTTLVSLTGGEEARETGRWCRVPLPANLEGELRFELAGAPCLSTVLAPRVHRAAPPPPERPDLVLFLADTLRADALGHAGGAADLTPELDRIAAESLRFTTARSPSTWTLPAQASMLSGVWPEQHGAVSLGHALPGGLVTLAEHLAEHGYRTGAVTDSAFVSRNYGMDQGFEWFMEFREWDLRATLAAARAFLDAGDGRPTFLFVQTYRVHMPYRTGPEESPEALSEVIALARQRCAHYGGDGSMPREEAVRLLKEVYDEGVRALDAAFGPWWRDVRARAPGRTFLVFTSDHGEAFFENGEGGHGGQPWEVKTRIPLLIQGPGIAARASDAAASLVDLPVTLATLAGVAPFPGWEGVDLLAAPPDRTDFSFVRIGEQPVVAVIDGTRKVFATADPESLAAGEVRGATDLALDPGEQVDVSGSEDWPAELARSHAGEVARLLEALEEAREAELSAGDRELLNAIGYGGE